MDAFDYAMKMEKDGEAYYRDLAAKAGDKGLTQILTFLADEEVKHFNIFKRMKEGKVEELPKSTTVQDVKNVFEKMRDSGETFLFDAGQAEYYKKAQEIEKESEDFYREQAKKTEDAAEAKMFEKIADEEKRHFFVLESIIEFVKRPEQWLEDAEWNHLEPY